MPSVKSTDFARNSQANLSSPLQLNADFHWIADTSATSHMTPHCHWFKSYTHYGTPIHFANNIVIYSASVGNVVFEPIVNGKQVKAVEFSQVLHVSDLRSNLLSCLYLTHHKGITINIFSHSMVFRQGRKTLFTASINSFNSATLNGCTVAFEAVYAVSTLLADLSLALSLYSSQLCWYQENDWAQTMSLSHECLFKWPPFSCQVHAGSDHWHP